MYLPVMNVLQLMRCVLLVLSASTLILNTFTNICLTEIQENQVDLPAAVAANQNAGTDEAVQGLAAVNTLLGLTITSKAAPVQTVAVENNNSAAAVATDAATISATSSKAPKATAATAKKGKNNGKRDSVLKWAKRVSDDY